MLSISSKRPAPKSPLRVRASLLCLRLWFHFRGTNVSQTDGERSFVDCFPDVAQYAWASPWRTLRLIGQTIRQLKREYCLVPIDSVPSTDADTCLSSNLAPPNLPIPILFVPSCTISFVKSRCLQPSSHQQMMIGNKEGMYVGTDDQFCTLLGSRRWISIYKRFWSWLWS